MHQQGPLLIQMCTCRTMQATRPPLSWLDPWRSQNRRGVRLTTWEEQCTAPYMEVMGLHRGELQDSGCFSKLFRVLHWPVHRGRLEGAWLGVEKAG